jgi:hypothetical protein
MRWRSLSWLVLWPAYLLFHVAWWMGVRLHHRQARREIDAALLENERLSAVLEHCHEERP